MKNGNILYLGQPTSMNEREVKATALKGSVLGNITKPGEYISWLCGECIISNDHIRIKGWMLYLVRIKRVVLNQQHERSNMLFHITKCITIGSGIGEWTLCTIMDTTNYLKHLSPCENILCAFAIQKNVVLADANVSRLTSVHRVVKMQWRLRNRCVTFCISQNVIVLM